MKNILVGLGHRSPVLCTTLCAKYGTPECACFAGMLPEAGYCEEGFRLKPESPEEFTKTVLEMPISA